MLRCARDTGGATLRRGRAFDMDKQFFVYILTNRPRGVLYVGVTNDLIRRVAGHKAKLVPGFTRTYGVIYWSTTSSIRPFWKLARENER